jgi:hypothetical protein
VVAWDPLQGRITTLRTDFKEVSTFNLPALGGRLPQGVVCSAGGFFVTYRVSGLELPIGPYRPTFVLHQFSLDGEHLGQFTEVPGDERYRQEGSDGPRTFGLKTIVLPTVDRVVVGTGEGPELWRYNMAGERIADIPFGEEMRPIRSQELEAYQTKSLATVESRYGRETADLLRLNQTLYEYPAHYAPYDWGLVGPAGNLWLREPSAVGVETETWLVISPDSSGIARVVMPVRFRLMNVGLTRIMGVWRDVTDVEFVRAYRLRR